MSTQAVKWVRDLRHMTGSQKAVLFVISEHANAKGDNSFPSVETIAAESGVSVKTVQRVIRSLTKLGLLEYEERTTRTGKYTSHMYSLPLHRVTPLACKTRLKRLKKAKQQARELEKFQGQDDTIKGQPVHSVGHGVPVNGHGDTIYLNHPLTTHEKSNEPADNFSKEKSGEKLNPEEKENYRRFGSSMPDADTQARWASGHWTDDEAEGQLFDCYKKSGRKNLPDWLEPFHQHHIRPIKLEDYGL